MEIKIFNNSVEKFIESLDDPTQAKIAWMGELLKRFGPELGMPYSKKVFGKIFELRIHSIQNVRIFYTFHGGYAFLLHGFVKKSDKIPKREIETAIRKARDLQ